MSNYKRILVTGGTGMVGSAFRRHESFGAIRVGSRDCDLTDFTETMSLLHEHRPDAVIHLAAKVGGVKGNYDFVGDFFRENMMINTNVLEACRLHKVPKVVSLLSTCIYPDKPSYPLTEDQIHAGEPHFSNFGYAYAKRMIEVQSRAYRQQYNCNFVTAVPNNIFGENDNFDLENSHVVPAIIRKVFEAKKNNSPEVVLWGDGSPLREFTYSHDIADALMYILRNYDDAMPINIGNTYEVSILKMAETIVGIMGYEGELVWDASMPSGQLQKPSSNQRFVSLGWDRSFYTPVISALQTTCAWFEKNYPNVRGIE